jgi:uncharacterized protein DUF6587
VNPVLDDILVAAALLASAVYALFALGPRTLRRRMLERAAGWALRAPAWCGLRGVAARLGAASVKASGACGGCDNCGSEGAATETSAAAGGADIKVPLASIGRRR